MNLYKISMLLFQVRERKRSSSRLIARSNKKKRVAIVSFRKRKKEKSQKLAISSRLKASLSSDCRVKWNRSVKLCLRREDKSVNTCKKCYQKTRDRETKLLWTKKLAARMMFKPRKSILVCLTSRRMIATVNSSSVSKEHNSL